MLRGCGALTPKVAALAAALAERGRQARKGTGPEGPLVLMLFLLPIGLSLIPGPSLLVLGAESKTYCWPE